MATKRRERSNPLLESLPELPSPPPRGVMPWYERMRINDPQRYQWMIELVESYASGDIQVRAKLRTSKDVYRYLRSQGFVDDSISESTFRGWLGKVGQNGET